MGLYSSRRSGGKRLEGKRVSHRIYRSLWLRVSKLSIWLQRVIKMYKVKLFENGVLISEHLKKTTEEVDTAVKIAEMFSTVTPSKKYTVTVEETED